MGRRGLALIAAALLLPPGLALAYRWIHQPVLPRHSPPLPQERTGAEGARGQHSPRPQAPRTQAKPGADPNLPLFVGDTRRIAARAIDDTAASPLDRALLGLGQRFVGTPARREAATANAGERLVLDLTAVDPLTFVEQLLALVNSRRVRTRTEAVDRFSDHVRLLRYGGRVAPCRRLHDPSLWSQAAERHGYLVDLTRFLPGARPWQRPLLALEPPQPAAEPQPTAARSCLGSRAKATRVSGMSLPVAALAGVLPDLRSGDVVVLVSRARPPGGSRIALVARADDGRVGALLVEPGQGVTRAPDLLALARRDPDLIGVSVLRPVPNSDGRRDR